MVSGFLGWVRYYYCETRLEAMYSGHSNAKAALDEQNKTSKQTKKHQQQSQGDLPLMITEVVSFTLID